MSFISRFLFNTYRMHNIRMRKLVLSLVCRIEKGECYSETLRKIFNDYHDIKIGLYTHGGCFKIGNFQRHTSIGRYCSIAQTVRNFNRDHPTNYKSTHAFFFNPILGVCRNETVDYNPLNIENDVWIGHNAIIMPHVNTISNGAVVAAGAVVHKDIPPYAVVVGNPARVVRYRFSKELINDLLTSHWWEKPIEELKDEINDFQNFL